MEEEIREVEPVVETEGPKRASPNKMIVIAVIGIVVVLVMLFAPFVPAKETYSESEQYERSASYAVDRSDWMDRWSISLGCYCDIYVKIRNTDVEGGTFVIHVEVRDIDGLWKIGSDSQYIGPGDSYQFHFSYDTDCLRDYTWKKNIDSPTIIDTHMVEKEKTTYKSAYQILTGG